MDDSQSAGDSDTALQRQDLDVSAHSQPLAGYLNALLGVVTTSAHNARAVGTTDWQSVIFAHWNGTTWQD